MSHLVVAAPPVRESFVDDSLKRMLDISDEQYAQLVSLLGRLGCRKAEDLKFLKEGHFQDSDLPPVVLEKLLLLVQFHKLGGTMTEVEGLEHIEQFVESTENSDEKSKVTKKKEDPVVALSVGGCRFETTRKTLCSVPDSPLEAIVFGTS